MEVLEAARAYEYACGTVGLGRITEYNWSQPGAEGLVREAAEVSWRLHISPKIPSPLAERDGDKIDLHHAVCYVGKD